MGPLPTFWGARLSIEFLNCDFLLAGLAPNYIRGYQILDLDACWRESSNRGEVVYLNSDDLYQSRFNRG
jgi:hypothetical protein